MQLVHGLEPLRGYEDHPDGHVLDWMVEAEGEELPEHDAAEGRCMGDARDNDAQ